jgi:hypothetical protein
MRKMLTSLGLSAGLLMVPAHAAFADEAQQSESGAQQALMDFVAYTNEHWSILGFSSAENARQVLGGDWYMEATSHLAGGQTFGSYGMPNDPMRGQPAQVGNSVEQNGTAFGGSFGSGHLEDDESNGSVITGNDSQGTEDDE